MTSTLPDGVWPVLPASLAPDLSPDRSHHRGLVDWYVEQGAAGIFPVSLSSEMYEHTSDERVVQAAWTVDDAAGRIPVVASALAPTAQASVAPREDPTAATIDAVQSIATSGVDAVVLIVSQLAGPDDSDQLLMHRLEEIVASTEVDLGLYECPLPYKRLLSDAHVELAAASGRFTFLKDTSHDVGTMNGRARLAKDSRLQVYNAQAQSVVETVREGGAGFCGWVGNVLPATMSWLVAKARDESTNLRPVQQFVSIAESVIGHHYPLSAKWLLRHQWGLPINPVSRMLPGVSLTPHQTDPLRDLIEYAREAGIVGAGPTTSH